MWNPFHAHGGCWVMVGYRNECNIVCVSVCIYGRVGGQSSCCSLVFAGLEPEQVWAWGSTAWSPGIRPTWQKAEPRQMQCASATARLSPGSNSTLWNLIKGNPTKMSQESRNGRSRGVGNGNPLQDSYLGNPVNRGVRTATVYGVAKSQTPLSDWVWVHEQTIQIPTGERYLESPAGSNTALPPAERRKMILLAW